MRINWIIISILSLAGGLCLTPESGWALQGQERGGGNSLAASMKDAANAFDQLVEQHPEMFPELDVTELKNVQQKIVITSATIKVCNETMTLDAYSDPSKGETTYNAPSIRALDWTFRVQIAGHEKLVLLGYESTNSYNISSRVFDAKRKEFLSGQGKIPGICTFDGDAGQHLCNSMKSGENLVEEFLSRYEMQNGEVNEHDLRSLFADTTIYSHTVMNTTRMILSDSKDHFEKSYRVRGGMINANNSAARSINREFERMELAKEAFMLDLQVRVNNAISRVRESRVIECVNI